MRLLTTLPFLVMLIGFVVYAVTTTKTWRQFWEDCGRIAMIVGLLVTLLSVAGKSVF